MACCASKPHSSGGPAKGKGGGQKIRRMDSQTEFMMDEHGWAFTRMAQLSVPAVARAAGAIFAHVFHAGAYSPPPLPPSRGWAGGFPSALRSAALAA